MDEFPCCFCDRQIGEGERMVALCWVDPHGVVVVAHHRCTTIFDGLPAWPRESRWLGL